VSDGEADRLQCSAFGLNVKIKWDDVFTRLSTALGSATKGLVQPEVCYQKRGGAMGFPGALVNMQSI
jgi:hypothetical protein